MVADGEMPAALVNEPELPRDLVFVSDAFWRLHTDRGLGFGGAGPIPNHEVVAEAGRLGMEADEADWFGALIAAMDGVYLKWADERRSKSDPTR